MDDSPPASTLPGLVEVLLRVDERIARIERRLEQLDELPNLVAIAMDSLDQHAAQLQARGVDLEERAHTALTLLGHITEPNTASAITSMLQLAQQKPDALSDIVRRAAQALSRAQQSAPRALGMFGVLRGLSDRGVQHALGFAMSLAREFGRSMVPTDVQRALPQTTVTHLEP